MTTGQRHANDTQSKWNKMQDEQVIRRYQEHENLIAEIESCACGNGVIGRNGICAVCGE